MSTMAMMTTTTTKISQRRPRIVLFGDSLTEFSFGGDFGGTTRFGWGSLLAHAFVRKADVYNRGYSGYTTTMALETALPTLFVDRTKSSINSRSQQEAPILFCTVFFGTNDAVLPSRPNSDGGRQHVPMCTYVENLRRIIDSIRKQTAASIIILTPPPLDEVKWKNFWGVYPYYDRTNATTRDYGLAAQRLVATMSIEVNTNDTTQKKKKTKQQYGGGGCYVLDTWELLEGDQGPDVFGQYLNHDGVHFNEHGNTKLYEGLMDVLTTTPDLQHCVPRSLEDDGPAWDELC